MQISRRACLALVASVIAVGTIATPGYAEDSDISVLVATNEPYGTYHIRSMVDHVEEQGGRIALVVPDEDNPTSDDVETVTLQEAHAWGADLLVVNGATEWPAHVVQELGSLDVVASSLAYLQPVEAEFAAQIRERLVGATAQSSDEAEVFAQHFGIDVEDITVAGNPQLDGLPDYAPVEGTVLVATSVTHPSETGGAAPGTELLLETAAALQQAGYHIRVGLHPREDPTLWDEYEIATEGTLMASTTADVVVGIPGSVFPQIAAVGAPLVGIMDPALDVPDYLLSLAAPVRTVEEAVDAAAAGWVPEESELASVVGPVGGSRERLWDYWVAAATTQAAPEPSASPTPSISTTPVDASRPGLPSTGAEGRMLLTSGVAALR